MDVDYEANSEIVAVNVIGTKDSDSEGDTMKTPQALSSKFDKASISSAETIAACLSSVRATKF
jgi:hypothetical protein